MALNPFRWKQRLENLEKAHARLMDACSLSSYSELELAGLIQTFEFTFELTWKTFKDLLEYEGYEVASPRSAIRTALQANHLTPDQCEVLLDALDKRNLLTHTYDEKNVMEAKQLILEEFSPVINELVKELVAKKASDA